VVADVLIDRIRKVLKERNRKTIVVAGGVSANTYIRSRMDDLKKEGIKVYYPPIKLCTDNAAMIASQRIL
jgi:probable O-sialoglycoprotein endopeptidase